MENDHVSSLPLTATEMAAPTEVSSCPVIVQEPEVVVATATRALSMSLNAVFDLEAPSSPLPTATAYAEEAGDNSEEQDTGDNISSLRDSNASGVVSIRRSINGSSNTHDDHYHQHLQHQHQQRTPSTRSRWGAGSLNTVTAALEEGSSSQFWDPAIPSATIVGPAPPKNSRTLSSSAIFIPGDVTFIPADMSSQELGVATAHAVPVDSQRNLWHSSPNSNVFPKRAEYFSATIIKDKEEDDALGVGLTAESNGDIVISSLDPNGKIFHTPFRVGDKLLSIQGKACSNTNPEVLESQLKQWEGSLTLVGQCVGGDSRLVEAMAEKPTRASLVEITLKQNRRGSLMVAKIDPSGLFAHSTLNIHDRILSINGIVCARVETTLAVSIIQDAPKYVTILAEKSSATGAVIAASETIGVDPRNSETAPDGKREEQRALALCVMLMLIVGILISLQNA